LAYPQFNKTFEIYIDASRYQLGAVISQQNKPIAFYSKKLNKSQLNYTTTEKELLAIVETLREFRNILLGEKVVVYTDHKNLTYKAFNTERVMRWRLIIEEYGPTLQYVKGTTNIVADALIRLHLEPSLTLEANPAVLDTPFERSLAESFTYEQLSNEVPTKYKTIQREQQKDKQLLRLARKSDKLRIRTFHGGGKSFSLIFDQTQIAIPKSLP